MNVPIKTLLQFHELYLKHKEELIEVAKTLATDSELPKDDADRYSRWIWEIVDRMQLTFHDAIREEL